MKILLSGVVDPAAILAQHAMHASKGQINKDRITMADLMKRHSGLGPLVILDCSTGQPRLRISKTVLNRVSYT